MSATATLLADDGTEVALPVQRWLDGLAIEEEEILDGLSGPVIDVGCGPGRHAEALSKRGMVVLGLDVATEAVELARARGVSVLNRSVFDRVPGIGRWATALILDGNIGIGGDPARLLTRVAQLVRHGGVVVVELDPPGAASRCIHVRLAVGSRLSPMFPWALLSVDDIEIQAREASFHIHRLIETGGRWFATLIRA